LFLLFAFIDGPAALKDGIIYVILRLDSFLGQGSLQPGYVLSQRANAHRVFQRGDGMRELQLLQAQLIFLDTGFQIRFIQVLQAIYEIDSL